MCFVVSLEKTSAKKSRKVSPSPRDSVNDSPVPVVLKEPVPRVPGGLKGLSPASPQVTWGLKGLSPANPQGTWGLKGLGPASPQGIWGLKGLSPASPQGTRAELTGTRRTGTLTTFPNLDRDTCVEVQVSSNHHGYGGMAYTW